MALECPKCGSGLSNRPERCPRCGVEIRFKVTSENSEEVAVNEDIVPRGKHRRSLVVIGFLVVGVAAVVVIAFALAFTLSWCRLNVEIGNDSSSDRCHVAVFIDEAQMDIIYIAPGDSFSFGYSLPWGSHKLGIDYSYSNSTDYDIDGNPDILRTLFLTFGTPKYESFDLDQPQDALAATAFR